MTGTSSSPPDGLDLVIDFVNTFDVEEGVEQLGSGGELAGWLRARGLLDGRPRLDQRDLGRALELREALRAIMLANNGGADDPGAVEVLERTARAGALRVRFGGVGAELAPDAAGLDGALAKLLVPVARAMEAGTWQRAKACRADDCRWAFYDRSRNRSGVWCDMAVCGNRTKVRAYRRRGPAGGGRGNGS
ncbi:MAG TPA: CGNR zinc finger domain-containing protein [Solirubrobacteraceae bacterium]|jgi:predicted RNA-binding Zn ribbon-like protein|nr:CGNR zinc finger domain-containing protein [Solirubrobacteraceae bacterium]